jgi:hypothetical protein
MGPKLNLTPQLDFIFIIIFSYAQNMQNFVNLSLTYMARIIVSKYNIMYKKIDVEDERTKSNPKN